MVDEDKTYEVKSLNDLLSCEIGSRVKMNGSLSGILYETDFEANYPSCEIIRRSPDGNIVRHVYIFGRRNFKSLFAENVDSSDEDYSSMEVYFK